MDQFRKRSLVNILSRQNTDSGPDDLGRPRLSTIQSNQSLFGATGETSDEKGPLGLNTLYEPPEPKIIADIIFIHGLGGGSRKTWSKTSNILHFWPKSWLPEDPDFQHVRIHSFGYKADWGERRESILNIHDFAQSLLGELKNTPSIRRADTRLILVGHSMGGCVAKKAYILARQDITCKDLAARIFSLFFLGTPHRGSDLAAILQNMLAVAWGAKPFVSDLLPNSATLGEINDAFRHYAGDLHIWSFYETLPVKAKVLNRIVVEKYSATLGYSNEEVSAMDADHRNVCKFDDNLDPNYRKLRNALCTAIDIIKSETTQSTPREALARVEDILGMADTAFEDDLASLQELRHPGSCAWFTEQPGVAAWRHADSMIPAILWLTGRPATGKSVLCSHIIDHLKNQNLPVSYFFFKHGKDGRSTLADCFRSIAYQMAAQDQAVLQRLLQLSIDGDTWDRHDERAMWRKLFVQNLFKLQTVSSHVWVVDGFDECTKFASWFKLAPAIPDGLRIFIASRSTDEIERGISSLGPRVQLESLTAGDTEEDMRAYLTDRLNELALENAEELGKRILAKSQGSFLWVRLVLQEFENAYTDEDIEAILNEVPEDLQALYLRMLKSIENEKRRSKLAKSIISWVALACRPLTVEELRCAVKLDIHETPHNMEKAIPTVCGQLVFVDQASRVHMIHETAREFVLREDLDSHLAVKKGDRHGHIALLCCRYLSGETLRPSQRLGPSWNTKPLSGPDTALVDYASKFFSDHLYRSNSRDEAPMEELAQFLRSNVLYWLEKIAQGGDLRPITRTAVNLAGYLRRRAKYTPPVDINMQTVDSWTLDLARVGAKFRSKLLACPSSIHCLIPPFCPSESIISRTFTMPTRSLTVSGSTDREWDDCLARIDFSKGQATALSYGDTYFAVGLSSGQVSIYDAGFIQHLSAVRHLERVRFLAFSPGQEYIAAAGQKHICLWQLHSYTQLWSWSLESPPLAFHFITPDILVHVNKAGQLISRNIITDDISTVPWRPEANSLGLPEQQPSKAVISSELGIFAIGYRSHPVHIFDLETGLHLGQCRSAKSNGVDVMVFNSNPDAPALIVSSLDGDMLVFDPRTTELKFRRPNFYAQTLACSYDGASLATGDSRGNIDIYEFDDYESNSLTLVYRINSSDEGVRSVAFNRDASRIINCQGSQACIWEPAILMQKDMEARSQSDISSQITIPLKTFGISDSLEDAEITSIACHSGGEYVICGKSNGEVALFSAIDGQQRHILYQHAQFISVISIIIVEKQHMLVTADESGRVLVAKMSQSGSAWSDAEVVMDRRFSGAIIGMLINTGNDRLLLSTKDVDEMWALPSGEVICSRSARQEGLRTICHHPKLPDVCIMFTITNARLFKWDGFEEVKDQAELLLQRPHQAAMSNALTYSIFTSTSAIVETLKVADDAHGTRLYCWDPSTFGKAIDQPLRPVIYEFLAPRLRCVIAAIGSTLLFLDADLWICSLDLKSFNQAPYAKRHFFILSEWLNVNGGILCVFTSKNNFVFVKKGGLLVVNHGLEFSETVTLSPQQDWKVHSGSMHRRTSTSITPSNRRLDAI
ncbi:hypothetical protein F5Y19DRAFT_98111 [Xylariaceae sp. FL1651]|nr:hypothetical protein F5Y19DRAFT_98111 [Xylariaceae sp. FL1651]